MYIQTRDPQRQMFLQPLARGCAAQRYSHVALSDAGLSANAEDAGSQQAAIPLAERLFEFMCIDSGMRSFSLYVMTQELLQGLRQIQTQVKHEQIETIMRSLEELLRGFANPPQRTMSAESVRQIVSLMTHAVELQDIVTRLEDICASLSANSALMQTIDTIKSFCENLTLYNRIGNAEAQPVWYIPLPVSDVFPEFLFAGVLFYPESEGEKNEYTGGYRMVIKLESVSLGRLSIDCTVRSGSVACVIHVDNTDTESLCQEHAGDLKKRLKQKKMTMQRFQCHCKEIQSVFPYVEVSV